jgi:CRP-like cAMP-binding protein
MKSTMEGYDQNHMTSSVSPIQPELRELLPPRLHDLCVTSAYAKGDRLFETGKKPAHMFFIASGEVILERLGVHGESVILQRTRHGFVGEASLQSARYHCDGKVVANSDITRVPIQDIRSAMESDPAFATRWIGMLNREVKRLRLQCERLSIHKVQDRLIHLLETEGQQGKYPLGSGLKSLARELGVTHEALYRCVSDMEKRNLLRRNMGYLSLLVSDVKKPAV